MVYSFKLRNPDITLAKFQKLSLVRAECTSKEVLDRYFDLLGSVISTSNLIDKRSNIWNIDETGIVMEHSPRNILCLKAIHQKQSRLIVVKRDNYCNR